MGERAGKMNAAALAVGLAAGLAAPAAAQDASGRGISIYGGFSYEHASRFLLDTVTGTTTIGGTTSTRVSGAPRSHDLFGGELTVAVPVSRWLAFNASGSYHVGTTGNNTLPGGTYRSVNGFTILVIPDETGIKLRQTSLTAVAGVELRRPHEAGRLSPFVRVQAGIARVTAGGSGIDQQRANINGGRNFSATSFAGNIGAGLDLRIGRNIDLRLIQADYRYVAAASRHMLSIGDSVDSLVASFSGGSTVTSLQSADARVSARHDFVLGAGIVVHFGR